LPEVGDHPCQGTFQVVNNHMGQIHTETALSRDQIGEKRKQLKNFLGYFLLDLFPKIHHPDS